MDQKKLVSEYITSQILGVVSTVNKTGNPEAALVAITEANNLNLIFGTYNTGRKYKNLMDNPHVAITMGNDVDEAITIQYEGLAEELEGGELDRCRDLHIKKNPRSEKYVYVDEQRFFIVKPTWIRYSDLAADPQVDFEINI